MASAPREVKELATLLRVLEPGSTNLGTFVAANAEALAPFSTRLRANCAAPEGNRTTRLGFGSVVVSKH